MIISKDEIRNHLKNNILNDSQLTIADDEDLLLSGLLDSINVMRLVSLFEKQCELSIPPDDVLLEHFGSINQMHAYLNKRAE